MISTIQFFPKYDIFEYLSYRFLFHGVIAYGNVHNISDIRRSDTGESKF